MKKIISILTATRAEYGLLKPVISKLRNISEFDVRIVATGMHLSPKFGLTYQEIENDGIPIDRKIEILQEDDSTVGVSHTMGIALIEFSNYFDTLKPDLLIVLGDRYETLAVCCAAMNARIPIAHLYGGETTEGAVDEAFRHAITKMSYLHFTSTEEYRNRVIQLGEDPQRVFCVGAMGIENILNVELMSKKELEQSIDFELDRPYAVVTFHPVTLEEDGVKDQIESLLHACSEHDEMLYIFTMANADANGMIINQVLAQYIKEHKNMCLFKSLGMLRYLSALKYCEMVIGNSSSGLIEAPSFGIPTINIGDRQRGRLQGDTIINCEPNVSDINNAIDLARSSKESGKFTKSINPYGDGNTSERIIPVIKEYLLDNKINLKKKFYDIPQ